MYQLFWYPNSSSYAPLAVLEELGVPNRLHQVDYEGDETQTPADLKRQPSGLVPALNFERGAMLFEGGRSELYD